MPTHLLYPYFNYDNYHIFRMNSQSDVPRESNNNKNHHEALKLILAKAIDESRAMS